MALSEESEARMEFKSLLNESALDLSNLVIGGSSDGILKVVSSTVGVYALSGQFSTIGDTISVINLNGLNTGMLAEGSNLYYTDARFDTRFALKSTTNLTEGSNLYYTDARSRAAISAGSGISYNSSTGVISTTGGGVLSITGVSNQVLANGTSGSAQTGAITLTLPQPIGITSAVRFGSIAVGTYSAYPLHIVSGNGYMLCDLSSTYAAQYVGVTSGGAELRIYGDNSGNAHFGTITNHDLGFRTNDVNRMTLSKDGYLGIAVAAMSGVYLDVYSIMQVRDFNAGLKIATSLGVNYIESASSSMTGSADLRFTDMNAANTWMTIKATTGRVGIGTTNPEDILHIAKSASGSVGPRIILDNTASPTTNNQCEISFLTDSGATGSSYNANIKAVADGSGTGYTALTFGTYGGTSTPSERVRINPSGFVGIGTINPQDNLDISTGAIRMYNSTDYNRIYSGTWGVNFVTSKLPNSILRMGEYNGNVGIWAGDGASTYHLAFGSASGKDIYLCPGNNPSLYAKSNGFIGVGESSPDLKFVSRDTVTTAQISARYNGTATANYKETQIGYNGASGNGYGWIQAIAKGVAWTALDLQPNGGFVGIGTTAPNKTLDVAGDIRQSWGSGSRTNYTEFFGDGGGNFFGGLQYDMDNRVLYVNSKSNDTNGTIAFKTGIGVGYATSMYINSSGNVTVYNSLAVGVNLAVTGTVTSDGGYLQLTAGNLCVNRGKTIQFSASPTSLDDSIHSVNAYPYGIRISGANDGANHRNTQFGYYDAGTWQNRFDFDGYSGWFFIANRTSVPGTPSGGGVLYVESGALKYKGSSGTVTTIAPA